MDFEFLLTKAWKIYLRGIVRLVLFFFAGIILCFTIVLIPTVAAGWARGILAYVRESKDPDFRELWNFDHYFQILALLFTGGLLISIGYCLLIVPGVLLSVWWFYALFFIVDKKMEFFEALKSSKEAVTASGFLQHLVLLLIVVFLNSIAGALVVGPLLTGPFTAVLASIFYLDIIEPHRLVERNPR